MKFSLRAMFSKPTSVQEAVKKRDTAKMSTLGCLAAAIICVVLGVLISLSFLETFGYIFIVLAAVSFYFWYRAKADTVRLQTTFCDCGEKYTYPDNVAYKMIGEQISSGKAPNNDNVIRHTNTKVALYCKCPKCGKERTVDTSFVTEESIFNKNGLLLSTKTYPLEDQLVNIFK